MCGGKELRLPVLLNPGVTSTCEGENAHAAQMAWRYGGDLNWEKIERIVPSKRAG